MKTERSKLKAGNMKLVLASTLLVVMAGCSTKVDQLSDHERYVRSTEDITSMFEGQEPVTGPITIGEAIARALKYNLDHRLKRMETALAARKYEFDRTGMLPRLVADAGYSRRSNDTGARSESVNSGDVTLEDSTSTERTNEFSDLIFTWNTLDFGLSYYTAKQSSNQVIMSS